MDNPYVVANCEDLQLVDEHLDATFRLKSDIDCSATGISDEEDENFDASLYNDGAGFDPIGNYEERFTGTFDGQGFVISDLTMNREQYTLGLFSYVDEGAVVQNVGMEDVDIYNDECDVGAIAGRNDGTITNVFSTGYVDGDCDVGGLVGGHNGSDTVQNSYSTATVTGYSSVGGLVGANYAGGDIINCYATGSVNGTWYEGGLVGYNQGSVNSSYSTGLVTMGGEGDFIGGLVGDSVGTVINSFYDVDISGQPDNGFGTPKETGDMKDVTTFTSTATEGLDDPWDFFENPGEDEAVDDIWMIDPDVNGGYPYFFWQISPTSDDEGSDMLGYWKFNESEPETCDGGEDACDSANDFDGTWSGSGGSNEAATWTENVRDLSVPNPYSMDFDGTDDRIGTDLSMGDMTSFTLAGWVRPTSVGNRVAFFGQNGTIAFGFEADEGGDYITCDTQGGATASWTFDEGRFPLDDWHHVACVGSMSYVRIYVDGEAVTTAFENINGDYGDSEATFNIGTSVWDSEGDTFTGQIDEVRTYNVALSPSAISTLANEAPAEDVAPTVETHEADSINRRDAMLNGEITDVGSSNVSSVGFDYGLTEEYTDSVSNESEYTAVEFSLGIESLACHTTYHFRAFAVNEVDTSYGDDMTFRTDPCGSSSSGGGGGSSVVTEPEPESDTTDQSASTGDTTPDETSATETREPSLPPGTPTSATAPSPYDGETEPVDTVAPGDFIRGASYPTVYFVTEDFHRRPFLNEATFATYQDSFDNVRVVTDATLPFLTIDALMLPKAGVTLVKVESTPETFFSTAPSVFAQHTTHWVPDETTAATLFGASWSDYVLDLPPTAFHWYVRGANMTASDVSMVDLSTMKKRVDLVIHE